MFFEDAFNSGMRELAAKCNHDCTGAMTTSSFKYSPSTIDRWKACGKAVPGQNQTAIGGAKQSDIAKFVHNNQLRPVVNGWAYPRV